MVLDKKKKNEGPRLLALLEFIPKCQVLADIGCDHGKLCALALEENRCQKAIACDISKASLQKAKELAAQKGFEQRMECRQGDGLKPLGLGEANVVVIAGMGGRLMAQILQQSEAKARKAQLVLQATQQTSDLRRYLREKAYGIYEEKLLLEDGRLYTVMLVKNEPLEYPKEYPAEIFDEIGPLLWKKKEPLLKEQLMRGKRLRLQEREKVLEASRGADADKKSRILSRLKELDEEIDWHEKVLRELT